MIYFTLLLQGVKLITFPTIHLKKILIYFYLLGAGFYPDLLLSSFSQAYPLYLYIETLKQRLDAINQLRLDRATASMDETFCKVYSLLPVLFHYHHPMIPGYIEGNVPYGVCFFTPDNDQKLWLSQFGKYLPNAEKANGELPITGIYSMGSTSSVGQSQCSDIDIWVCHPSWLDNEEKRLLQKNVP